MMTGEITMNELFIIVSVFWSIIGFICWAGITSQYEYKDKSIGEKAATALWCGPIIWTGALFVLLHNQLAKKINEKYGE